MTRSERNLKALGGASKGASEAFDALRSPNWKHVPEVERVAWLMAAVIHCDMCRLTIFLDECEPGLAALLTMSDIVSKLYEAKKWYFGPGAATLQKIAEGKISGRAPLDARLTALKRSCRISAVERYAIYRNKIGHHYDAKTPDHLLSFSQEDSDAFYDLLRTFVRFSHEWVRLTRDLIQEKPATP